MQGKIALEEHLAIEATLGDSKVFGAHVWDTLHPRLLDVQEMRLREMDIHGIEMMILSLNAPAISRNPSTGACCPTSAPRSTRPSRGRPFFTLPKWWWTEPPSLTQDRSNPNKSVPMPLGSVPHSAARPAAQGRSPADA